jgi:fumarate reductase subunit C
MSHEAATRPRREHVRPVPATWWLKRRTYFLFMLRELTCLAVGGYAIFLIVVAWRARDAGAFASLVEALKSPLSVALHLVVLALAVYHSVTWINLTPKIMVVYRGEDRVNPALIAGAHYAAWAAASALVLWLALRGG